MNFSANFLRNNQITPRHGFCLPASCSDVSVVEFLNQQILMKNDLIVYSAECRTNDWVPFDPIDYFAIVLITIISLLVITSTSYDIIMKQRAEEPNRLYIAFSVYTNGAKLFDVTKIKSSSSLNCLHGLRAMSVFYIILGHQIEGRPIGWGNPNDVAKFEKSVYYSVINGYYLAVDTFFVMGALLMTWSTLRDCEKQNLNILRMIWKRYLRYTPVYAMVILIIICFFEYLFSGPAVFEPYKRTCVKNWWMALLHIQNYLDRNDTCLLHCWYLNADFQLFLISPFIVYLIHKFGKKLLTLPVVLCLVSIIYAFTLSMAINIRFLEADGDSKGQKLYKRWIYYQTLPRAGPWFIGIVLGYYLYLNRGKTIKISTWLNAFMWILSLSALVIAMLVHYAFSLSSGTPTAVHAFFIAVHKNIWALGLCWIIFACQNLKTGGIIRWFLSLPQWQPISRMSLSMYVTGVVYQVIMIYNQRVPLYLNFWQVFPILWSDIVAIIIISTFFYLAIEVPPMIFEDYLFKKYQNSKNIVQKSEKV